MSLWSSLHLFSSMTFWTCLPALIIFAFVSHDIVSLFIIVYPMRLSSSRLQLLFLVKSFWMLLQLLYLVQSFWSRLHFFYHVFTCFLSRLNLFLIIFVCVTPVTIVLMFCSSTVFISSNFFISCISVAHCALATNGSYCWNLQAVNVNHEKWSKVLFLKDEYAQFTYSRMTKNMGK